MQSHRKFHMFRFFEIVTLEMDKFKNYWGQLLIKAINGIKSELLKCIISAPEVGCYLQFLM